MPDPVFPPAPRARPVLLAIAAFAATTALLVAGAWRSVPAEKVCPDFIQFWTAATLLAAGQDPYAPALQAAVQGGLGWDRMRDGYGIYDFLPYYYPPWLGLAFVPLLPLGYPLAKLTWLVVGGEMLLAAGFVVARTLRGVTPPVAIGIVLVFAYSLKAVVMGQVAPLVLLLVALEWKLLETRRDRAAGVVLALLTIKPQLTALLAAALLARAARERRWTLWRSFAATLAVLAVASTVVFPGWLPSMLAATRETPMPTAYYPGLGATWYVVLGAVGLAGVPLQLAYLAVAVPILLALMRHAVRGGRTLEDLFGLALVAPFFVAPYARPYDFPVLLVPALVVISRWRADFPRQLFAVCVTVLPALHALVLAANHQPPVVGVRRPEFTTFWFPLLVALTWWWNVSNKESGNDRPINLRDDAVPPTEETP